MRSRKDRGCNLNTVYCHAEYGNVPLRPSSLHTPENHLSRHSHRVCKHAEKGVVRSFSLPLGGYEVTRVHTETANVGARGGGWLGG